MKKALKKKDDETLDEWCFRLAFHLTDTKEQCIKLKEILREVSITSYTIGSNTAINILNK